MVRILDMELYRHTDDVFDGPAHGALSAHVRPRLTSSSFIGPGLPGPYPVLLPKNQLGRPGSILIF
ncbi:hypothetical protein PVL29_026596 [Vitis rotundifolia]|uniref:Uncharacterized protein n=1 Tax=Vitis rotundifolia TaxID=103349 RepID=A0AA38YGR0_VITRO|nr:hypothetical protein PVL29_026596 [Vitis rotundifolia]